MTKALRAFLLCAVALGAVGCGGASVVPATRGAQNISRALPAVVSTPQVTAENISRALPALVPTPNPAASTGP